MRTRDANNENAQPALFLIINGKIACRWLAEDQVKRTPAAEIINQIRATLSK